MTSNLPQPPPAKPAGRKTIRVLHLEDTERDAELIQAALEADEFELKVVRVDSGEKFAAALEGHEIDLILSDYTLPSYDGLRALKLAREKRPDIPFIFVSGTIGEERAVDSLKNGALDYVLKQHLARLPAAVRRAIEDAALKKAQAHAQAIIAEQAALLDKANDAIIVRDMEHRIVFWNSGAERLYGHDADEVLGKSVLEVLYTSEPPEFKKAVQQVLREGNWQGELKHVARDGRELIVDSHWTLVRETDERPKSILVINTDVTEKKKLQEQFLRAQRMEGIGSLASGIAHDLNNALAPVLMATQLLESEDDPEQKTALLQTITSGAERSVEMVRQILTFARGTEEANQPLQLRHLIHDIVKFVQAAFPRPISVKYNLPEELWMVLGNSTQIHQLVLNLCVNARDAMPEGGTISITVENITLDDMSRLQHPEARPGRHVAISVADTGTGIPPEVLSKIFTPFFTTKPMGKGTGLGLSTVESIARRHNGFVRVQSQLGEGSRFTVHLPAHNRQVDAETVARPSLPAGNGELILVADDEVAIREITKVTLENYGYRVQTAADGIEAIAYFAAHQKEVDLVITDMSMPYLGGPATIRSLLKISPGIRIIAASGTLDSAEVTAVTGDESVEVLLKPFSTEQLLNAIHRALATKPS